MHNKQCPICKNNFKAVKKKQIFCSNKCRGEDRKGTKAKRTILKECILCGKSFYGFTYSKYCSRKCCSRSRCVEEKKIKKRNEDQTKRTKRIKRWLFEYKEEHRCEKCGFLDPRALVFHHKNSDEKEFNIGRGIVSKLKLEKELKKCIVLCANCHSIEHFNGKYLLTED